MKKEFNYLLWMCGIYIIWAVIGLAGIPLISGFFLGGFEQEYPFQLVFLYSGTGFIFVLGIVVIAILTFYFGKKSGEEIILPIHNPIVDTRFLRPLFLLIFSIILFSILGIFGLSSQTFFSDTPRLQQQFTPTGQVLFSMFPASIAENAGAYFWSFLVIFILIMFLRNKVIRGKFLIILIASLLIFPIVFGLYGYANHKLRYGNSDLSTVTVVGFWAFGGFITAATQSVIPFEVAHAENNMLLKISELSTIDYVIGIFVSIIIILTFLGIILYFYYRAKKKNTF